MAAPGRNIHIRLASEDAQRFDELAREFSGLQKGTVLRLLIAAQLQRPTTENIELIDSSDSQTGMFQDQEHSRNKFQEPYRTT